MDSRDRLHVAVALVVAGLIFGAWWLMSELRLHGKVEECLMQRRRNCDQLVR